MIEYSIVSHIILSLVIGFIIGLQRELNNIYRNRKDLAGSRTFALVALLGYLGAFLNVNIFLGLIVLIGVGYYINAKQDDHKGITTEVALILTYLLGILIAKDQVLAIFIAVLIVFILNIKDKLVQIEEKIDKEEIDATAIFLLITLTVLPVLPNETIDKWNLINPFKLWLFVVLVSSISFVGYILSKRYSDKGIYLTGFLGGLVSSTATTIIFSKRSKENELISKETAIGISLANSMMFFRVFLWVLLLNISLAMFIIIPFVLASFSGFLYLYILSQGGEKITQKIKFTNPFDVIESIKYGLLFGIVFIAIKLGYDYLGNQGLYIVSIIAGISDVDAITIALSEMPNITTSVAGLSIIIATIFNQISKLVYSFFLGSRENFRYFAIFNTITILVLLSSYLLVSLII
ncbi:MAG: MgtC/SapB family protein [Sulfurovaceae bacterium]|nr:MgtC/SapB family protein [Sulfurovaceae bacterium]